jgi:26S proteasome non-ATPase regulatory subunit 9
LFDSCLIATARFGLTGSFIDDEGFPYDETELIIETKLQRQRHAMLQNDHRDTLARIQRAMPAAFGVVATDAPAAATNGASSSAAATASSLVPFARVDAVTSNSPADHAGLKVGDRVLRFGRVNSTRATGQEALVAVRDIVAASENARISVVVERDAADGAPPGMHVVGLVPRRWSGQGLLGCLLVPL